MPNLLIFYLTLLEVIPKIFYPAFVFFSIAVDLEHGREALKTLLYSKVVVRGQSVELLLECTYMDEYGGDSKSSKRASDDVCSIIFQKI